ncbi:tetratricopeptide repeat protein [Longitalea luteola]|uniref:tetratricopeptide repeat protein n=1 Tax=Longitalea luteola TaxID=2812563 RepID=UPI001A968A33|nr:hypothetical protein [Longitalea luteola]
MNCKSFFSYLFLLIVLFVTACSEPERPVTKEEAAKIAAALEDAIANRNSGFLNSLLSTELLEKRIMEQSDNKLSRSLVANTLTSIKSGDFGRQVIKSLGKTGTYELVKQYEKNNHQHLIFRLYDQEINYHDFELVKVNDQVKIADVFVYVTGENLSTSYAEMLLSMKEEASKPVDTKDARQMDLMKKYINEKEYEKANKIYHSLPEVLKKQKIYKIIYTRIASGLGTDEYLASLINFQKEYPQATNMYLLMMDAYYLKKDYPGTLRCINGLDSLINKDPFLDYYRALIYRESHDAANQLLCLERLHQNLPDYSPGTLELIYRYVEDNRWDKAIPLTKAYTATKNADQATIDNLYEMYPAFKDAMDKGQ